MFGLGSKDEDNAAREAAPKVILRTLRDANFARQREWDPSDKIDLTYRLNELAGEVGEACNILKKLDRDRLGLPGSRATKDQLAEELADIVICIDLILMGEGLRPVDATTVQMDSLTASGFGVLFAVRLGRACADWSNPDREILRNNLHGLELVARSCAAKTRIDMRIAVMHKFNATSEKVGLQTRLDIDGTYHD